MSSLVSGIVIDDLLECQGYVNYKIDLHRDGWQNTACLSFVKLPFPTLAKIKEEFLHPQELQKFSEITYPKRKHSFLLGRYAAKKALAQYLPEKPNEILVHSGIFQQPLIAHSVNSNLGVSIAHAEQVGACVVFPREHPMGLDFELIRVGNMSKLSFPITKNERRLRLLMNKSDVLHQTILWTAKEALSKVLATGLMTPLTVYEIKHSEVREKYILSTFTNFGQYKAITYELSDCICTLVLPLKTNLFVRAEHGLFR